MKEIKRCLISIGLSLMCFTIMFAVAATIYLFIGRGMSISVYFSIVLITGILPAYLISVGAGEAAKMILEDDTVLYIVTDFSAVNIKN